MVQHWSDTVSSERSPTVEARTSIDVTLNKRNSMINTCIRVLASVL